MKTLACLAALSLALTACDDDGGATQPFGGGGGEGGPRVTQAQAPLRAAHAVPQAARDEAVATGSILMNGLFVATAQAGTGQVVMHGTITQQGGAWRWSAEPRDALVVEGAGESIRFTVQEAVAADLSSPEAALNGDHRLRYTAQIGGRLNLSVTSVRQGGQRQGTLDGTLTVDDVAWTLDGLRSVATEQFDSDSSGSQFVSDEEMSGGLRAGDVSIQLDERWHFELVSSSRPSRSAQSAQRRVNTTLTVGGDRYTWENCTTQKAFKDGKPSDDNFWKAEGEVRRNGSAWGRYRLATQNLGTPGQGLIFFILDTPEGEIELERIQAF